MIGLIVKWVAIALSLVLVSKIVPGITVADWQTAAIAGLVIGLINALIKPSLRFITFPITILTLGLFVFLINALLFGLAAYLVPGFEVAGFVPALLGSILLTLVYGVFELIFKLVSPR